MIVHIIDDEKFLNKALRLFEDIFPGQNVFLVGVGPSSKEGVYSGVIRADNVFCLKTNSKEYNNTFKTLVVEADLLFFHNLYKDYKLKLRPYIPNNTKVAWYFWGAELYGLNNKVNNLMPLTSSAYKRSLPLHLYLRKQILAKLKKVYTWYLFKKILKSKVDYILTNITEDIELLNEYSTNSSKRGWFTYFSFDHNLQKASNSNKQHILVGNSSSETNNHFDAFELLSTKNITDKVIYIPLNYGEALYRDIVIEKAYSLFNEQASPIIEFLTLEEYNSIINSCAVLIMNHKRQQAFNTIMLAIAAGCKVFLREENTIYSCLKREGFRIFSIQSDFHKAEALKSLTKLDQQHNKDLAKKLYAYPVVKEKIKEQILKIISE